MRESWDRMQRYFAKEKKEDIFILEPLDYHHIKHVMRMKEKEQIEVVIDGILYLACVQNIDEEITVRLLAKKEEHRKEKIKKVICIPYLKEQKMDMILQKATELGVDTILITPLERSLIKWKEEKEMKKIERWMRIVKEAAEQSKRLIIPKVIPLKETHPLENLKGLKMLCSTQSECKSLKKWMKTKRDYDTINMVFGPEGGLTKKEEEMFIQMGYEPVHLGNQILRTETVPLYLLSVLNYEFME